MAAFHYQAMLANGRKQKGVIEAESEKQARQFLRNKGLIPFEIKAAHTKTISYLPVISRKQNLTAKELALMTRQLATLLTAGLPLEEALLATSEQTEKSRSKGLILSVRSKIIEGHTLASALRDFPHAFSNLYCSTIAAGEKSGHLDIVLQRMADYTEQQYAMRQKIMHALIYPAIMILVAMGILGFLLEYVVPKMIAVYSNIGQSLPDMTRLLISISDLIKNDGLYIVLILGTIIWGVRHQLKRNELFRKKFYRLLLSLPLLGNATKAINTARFSRTFAILSSSGISVLEAMSISSALMTNPLIRSALEQAIHRVREGASIYLALKQTQYFPPMSIHLIASGEASGQLEDMLERAANNQDADIARLIETTLALFEPAIILIMGAIVLFIVLAVLLPIFQLDQFNG